MSADGAEIPRKEDLSQEEVEEGNWETRSQEEEEEGRRRSTAQESSAGDPEQRQNQDRSQDPGSGARSKPRKLKLKWFCQGCGHLVTDKPVYKEKSPERCVKCPQDRNRYTGPLSQSSCQTAFKKLKKARQQEQDAAAKAWAPPQRNASGSWWSGESGEGAERRGWHSAQAPAESSPQGTSWATKTAWASSHSWSRRSQTPGERSYTKEQEYTAARREESESAHKKDRVREERVKARTREREQERARAKARERKDREREEREKRSRSRRRKEREHKQREHEQKVREAQDRLIRNRSQREHALSRISAREAALQSAASVACVSVDARERSLAIDFQKMLDQMQDEDKSAVSRLNGQIELDFEITRQ